VSAPARIAEGGREFSRALLGNELHLDLAQAGVDLPAPARPGTRRQ
jgi:hypothetical protein